MIVGMRRLFLAHEAAIDAVVLATVRLRGTLAYVMGFVQCACHITRDLSSSHHMSDSEPSPCHFAAIVPVITVAAFDATDCQMFGAIPAVQSLVGDIAGADYPSGA
jgi:hypothetical protein